MAPDLKIKPTNYVANLHATPKNTQFHPIINFLNNCPLTHALTATPTMDQQRLLEFWSTASTDTRFTHLSGNVNGIELVFTSTTLARVLHLPTDPKEEYIAPPTTEQIWEMLEAIRYKEKNPKVSSIERKKMSPCWSFFFDALIRCISGKTGSWYKPCSSLTLHLAYGLIMGSKIDYAKLIFYDICKKVGNDHLLYPRFLTLMMQTQVKIQTPVLILPLSHISDRVFVNKPVEEGEKHLTVAMLSLNHPVKREQGEDEVFLPSPTHDEHESMAEFRQSFDDEEQLLDSNVDSRSIVCESTVDERLCVLENALKEQSIDKQYCVSRFDEIAATLSHVVTSLNDIQERVTSTCTKEDVQEMISGVEGELSSVNGRLNRLIDETLKLPKFRVTKEDDPSKFQEELTNKANLDMLNAKRKEEAEKMEKKLPGDTLIRLSLAKKLIKSLKSCFRFSVLN